MSYEQRGQLYIFECDECFEEREISGGDFRDAWEALKDDGWRCFQNGDEGWDHRCEECRRK